MVFNSTSFLNGNEHWIPLCLPKFNAKGFLHAYIWAEDNCAIILISADKNAFFNMREVKEKVHTELVRNGIWDKILTSVRRGRYLMCTPPFHNAGTKWQRTWESQAFYILSTSLVCKYSLQCQVYRGITVKVDGCYRCINIYMLLFTRGGRISRFFIIRVDGLVRWFGWGVGLSVMLLRREE
jgi:hypothetical protein